MKAIVLGLVTLLSCATSSYAYSTSDDMHPLVECLNSVYDVFVYGLVFEAIPLPYHCYNVLRHYSRSDIGYSDDLKFLANSGLKRVLGMAWRLLGKFANVVLYLLPDGHMKKMLIFSTEIFEILSKLYDSMITLHTAKQIF